MFQHSLRVAAGYWACERINLAKTQAPGISPVRSQHLLNSQPITRSLVRSFDCFLGTYDYHQTSLTHLVQHISKGTKICCRCGENLFTPTLAYCIRVPGQVAYQRAVSFGVWKLIGIHLADGAYYALCQFLLRQLKLAQELGRVVEILQSQCCEKPLFSRQSTL